MNRSALLKLFALTTAGVSLAARPAPAPSPTPAADPESERAFARAKAWWRNRTELPYVTFAILVRYKHSGHVFDNWWDGVLRTSDNALKLSHIMVPADDAKRLKGFPLEIFGFKIFDTNPDAEPIRLDTPLISPIANFGVISHYSSDVTVGSDATPNPLLEPEPNSTPLKEVGRIEVSTRDYDVRLNAEESLRYGTARHLALRPLRDPRANRLRDLWFDPQTGATVQLTVDGIFNGKPYDAVPWTVSYVPLDGRWYVQQVRCGPMRFGLNVGIDAMEIDLVDYHFPASVPQHTFDKLL